MPHMPSRKIKVDDAERQVYVLQEKMRREPITPGMLKDLGDAYAAFVKARTEHSGMWPRIQG